MLDRQSKNSIKAVAVTMLSLVLGEGVLGVGVYWIFLFMLLEWKGVYWLALVSGLLISSIYKIGLGLPSLLMVLVVGVMSMVSGYRKEMSFSILVIALTTNFIFDNWMGIGWSIWDALAMIAVFGLSWKWFERSESIKISYH